VWSPEDAHKHIVYDLLSRFYLPVSYGVALLVSEFDLFVEGIKDLAADAYAFSTAHPYHGNCPPGSCGGCTYGFFGS
jgi:hypothetical protein